MPEQNNTDCQSCGAPGARVITTKLPYTAPFGKPVEYDQKYTECDSCGFEVDVSDPDVFPNAIREAEINSVEEMLKFFKASKIPQGRIERALGLPSRQVSNWMSKEAWSKSALAVMRFLRAYPWLIDVADKRFSEDVVQEKLIEAASKLPIWTQAIYGGFGGFGDDRKPWVSAEVPLPKNAALAPANPIQYELSV